MTATTHPLGLGMLGQVRVGDELASGARPLSQSLGITYTVAPSQWGIPLGVTYTVQKPNTAIMQVYYVCAPPQAFAINGDSTIVAPDQVTYVPRSVSARTLIAGPLLQGYESMIWVYTLLREQEADQLLAFYNPANPRVLLTYPDERGIWVQRYVSMIPPTYGTRETVSVQGLTLGFLLLTE